MKLTFNNGFLENYFTPSVDSLETSSPLDVLLAVTKVTLLSLLDYSETVLIFVDFREDPHAYVDNKKRRRPLFSLMSKIRATQSLGALMSGKGLHSRAYEKYKNLINEALEKTMREEFATEHQQTLEDALVNAEKKQSPEEQAWVLRHAIDSVYDCCIESLNVVPTAKPPSLHNLIKDAINVSSNYIHDGNYERGIDTCTDLLKKMVNSRTYRELVSPAAKKLVTESLETVEMTDDKKTSASKIRASLDRVYNEIRLPDVYSPSAGPQVRPHKPYIIYVLFSK